MAPMIVAVIPLTPISFREVCHSLKIRKKIPTAISKAKTTIFNPPRLLQLSVLSCKIAISICKFIIARI